MKEIKFTLTCDYCEKKSRSCKLLGDNAGAGDKWDGWEQTESETICPDCLEEKNIPKEEIGNRLREVFKFKNLKRAAIALGVSPQNLTRLNSKVAGPGVKHLAIVILALAKALPLKKRRKILSNIDFLLDS